MKKIFCFTLFLVYLFVFSQQKWDIKFYSETKNREFTIIADNEEFMPISAKFNFKLTNLLNTLYDGETVVIPPRTKGFVIAVLKPIDPFAANELEYTNSYNFGNVLQEDYDADYIYSLPFEKGKTQLVFQGYNGTFSHQNELALDLNLKMGDKIFAAREGTVVEVIDLHNQNCPDISCAKFNNKILIMHSDGTFADYSHLKFKGAVVKKGDMVEKGQMIGYSGKTGYSSGPHLHFAVFINRMDGKRTSVKTLFKTSESEALFLEEGKSYTRN